jgi:DNA polymerase III alpha subunit
MTDKKKTYIPLHVHSYYSLLDGLSSPKALVQRCVDLGLPGCAITDHGNISAMKTFYDACSKAKIQPIIGCEMYICQDDASIKTSTNNKRWHLIVLAKNDQGIKDLMALISETNKPEHFYRKPRIHMEGLAPFAKNGNLFILSACIGGELPSSLFADFKAACSISEHGGQDNLAAVRSCLRPDWKDVGKKIIERFVSIAGKGNYFLEIQDEGMSVQTVVTECLRELSKETGVPTVATIDAHYAAKEDAEDQRLLLYAQLHTTKEEQARRQQQGIDIMDFMVSDNYYIPSYDEMREKFTEEELQASIDIAKQIQYSSLGHDPYLPVFTNKESKQLGLDSNGYLKHLCIEGARKHLSHLDTAKKKIYWNRLQRELIVIAEAKLADYFLIVWDACLFVDKHNGPRGKGRGSGAGSLVNYLTGITGIDPIEYGLYFERFYNMSRNIPPHFDVGATDFMSWMSDNFELLHTRDAEEERKTVALHLARRIKNKGIKFTDSMREEVEWIDAKNPRMWMYLHDMIKEKPAANPSNSHLAYGLGMTIVSRDELDKDRKVKTHKGHISLPDIDTDIGVVFRSEVISYLKKRWGEEYVAQMITFGRLQGKAALKEVFRANPDTVKHLMKVKALKEGKDENDISITPHDLCNEITKYIPDEAAIADELRQARDDQGDDYGILQWAVHNVDQVQNAYEWFKPLFDQAMRIEGTKKSQSKHAAGVVIADRPIEELTPMAYDAKNKDRVVGLEMSTAEALGAVKFDFLGVVALDKMWKAQDLINGTLDDEVLDEAFVETE